jgi:hypothetical protein
MPVLPLVASMTRLPRLEVTRFLGGLDHAQRQAIFD